MELGLQLTSVAVSDGSSRRKFQMVVIYSVNCLIVGASGAVSWSASNVQGSYLDGAHRF